MRVEAQSWEASLFFSALATTGMEVSGSQWKSVEIDGDQLKPMEIDGTNR